MCTVANSIRQATLDRTEAVLVLFHEMLSTLLVGIKMTLGAWGHSLFAKEFPSVPPDGCTGV